MFRLLLSLIVITLLAVSCDSKPKPIEYGSDACTFCKMTIVDRQHGAEIVTKKGKVYKYDAIECLIRDVIRNRDTSQIALFLVTDFAKAGKFTDAQKAVYLISKNIPSPMGANLSGFRDKSEAQRLKMQEGGKLFTWEQLLERFK